MRHPALLSIMLVLLSAQTGAFAQSGYYDPLLDPACKVLPSETPETVEACWMWYPGQLAAYLQAANLAHSKQRCVNVGYPGNYFNPSPSAVFSTTVNLRKETAFEWWSGGPCSFTVDGKEISDGSLDGSVTLPKGKHSVSATVMSDGRLPALLVAGLPSAEWKASIGSRFLPVESDALYNSPSVLPDSAREMVVEVPVSRSHLVRGATESDGRLELRENALAVLDFKYLELANLSLEVSGNGTLSLYFGESYEEALAMRQSDHEQALIAPYELGDGSRTIVTPQMGYRYVALRTDGRCTVSNVKMLARVWPVDFLMEFDCADEDLNRLFAAGIATQHASMHNFYLDGVKRDFLPWAMDAVVSSIGGDYAFGQRQLSRNGISIALLPPDATKEDLGVVDYPLHALVGLWQEYLRYGSLETSLLFRDRIEGQLALYESLQDERGFISSYDRQWGFIPGWDRDNGPENIGTPAYAQMLLYVNFLIASDFEALWGDKNASKHLAGKAEALARAIMEHFWDEDRKAFVNGYDADGKLDPRLSHHSQSWAVYAGLFPEECIDHLFSAIYPSMEYYLDDISYEKGYEAISYIKSDRTAEFVDVLKKVWLRWLNTGNTRFPENFMINEDYAKQLEFYERPFGLSLCHGANGVPPIVTALKGILGFDQQTTDSYALTPDLIGMPYASGRIPVSQGFIEVKFISGGISTISIPAGCTVNVSFEGKVARYTKKGTYTL